MTGQELATRQAVPQELVQAGVKIQTDDDGHYRSIEFPPAIHGSFNVLLPVSEIAKTDPNYTPTVRVVHLQDDDFYQDSNAPKGTLSPKKTGLLKIARTANIGIPSTRRMSVRDLGEGKIGWQATVLVRRSDGTEEPVTSSKVVDLEVEKEKVAAGVRKSGGTEAQMQENFRRRWLVEREHMEAKCETKAIERAIRAALQIPHAFAPDRVKLPFLVVGFNFTPDAETAQLLALHARGRMFGLSAGELPAGVDRSTGEIIEGSGEPGGAAPVEPGPEAPEPQTTPPADVPPVPATTPEPEPEPEPDPPAVDAELAVAEQAGGEPILFGKNNGTLIRDVDDGWLGWALRSLNPTDPDPAKADSAQTCRNVVLYARVFKPAVYQAALAARETSAA